MSYRVGRLRSMGFCRRKLGQACLIKRSKSAESRIRVLCTGIRIQSSRHVIRWRILGYSYVLCSVVPVNLAFLITAAEMLLPRGLVDAGSMPTEADGFIWINRKSWTYFLLLGHGRREGTSHGFLTRVHCHMKNATHSVFISRNILRSQLRGVF